MGENTELQQTKALVHNYFSNNPIIGQRLASYSPLIVSCTDQS